MAEEVFLGGKTASHAPLETTCYLVLHQSAHNHYALLILL